MADAIFDLFLPRATLLRNFINFYHQAYHAAVWHSRLNIFVHRCRTDAGSTGMLRTKPLPPSKKRAPAREPETPPAFEGEAILTPKAPARRSYVGASGHLGTKSKGADEG
jgi:hypothetical protein